MRTPSLLLVLAAVLAGITSSSARSAPPLLAAAGTATVDGVMGPGEWVNAARADFTVNGSSGWNASGPGSLLVMNDATNIYVAVVIPGSQPSASSVGINFDNNDDGTLGEGDDVMLLNPWIGFYDEFFTKQPPCPVEASFGCLGIFDTDVGGTNDGQGQMRNNGSFSFYEMSHPLNSADDAHDFSLSRGDVIGITRYSDFTECDGHTCVSSSLASAPLHVLITPYAQPTVTSFWPSHAIAGKPVELTGTHFVGATSVTFGGVSADFEVASNGSIATAVPDRAKTGVITVTTPGGVATSATRFVVDNPHPAIAPPTTTPKSLRAGAYATVRFAVTHSDSGAPLDDGRMICDPSFAGKVLAHTERFAGGTASLRFLVPKSAKGKTLAVRLTIRWQGTSATRTARFRVG